MIKANVNIIMHVFWNNYISWVLWDRTQRYESTMFVFKFTFSYITPFTIKIVSRCFTEAETPNLNLQVSIVVEKSILLTERETHKTVRETGHSDNPSEGKRKWGNREGGWCWGGGELHSGLCVRLWELTISTTHLVNGFEFDLKGRLGPRLVTDYLVKLPEG